MAEKTAHQEVDLSESSIYGNDDSGIPAYPHDNRSDRPSPATGGVTTDAEGEPGLTVVRHARDLDRDKNPDDADIASLDASTAEEIDALEVNLYQEDDRANARDGSGRIVDDIAEERLAEVTEVGPDLEGEGAESLVPGNDNTSATLRRHHPNTGIARAEAIDEGNLDEARDEIKSDAKVDEGFGS